MIGQNITDDKGIPISPDGKKLSESVYQPSEDIKKLFARVQTDYQIAYSLQHRTFDEFDGISLLDRANLDQRTFGAFVGAEWVPKHKAWRWRGRKNTSRNKIIGILAHLLSAMLFPYVMATNEQDEEDKMTARVMRILVEEHLRKAGYEMKFLFIVLSALVNPAVFVGVEYVVAFQRVKQRMADGSINVIEAVDELLSGINLNIIPIDEILLADFYTFDLQRQPYLIRVRRISWDEARKIYGNNDNFKYVEAGKTRIILTGQENQTLYDIEWTEADGDFVQEMTAYYRDEDLQVTWVGGVFMGNENDVYNSNPFEHRRMSVIGEEWVSIPVYPFAKTGFEPLDPAGRFAYYKSAAFKEYWDDKYLNTMYAMVHDGTALDVIKPVIISGATKFDSTIMIPGATIAAPKDATAVPYSLGPNLKAAYDFIAKQEDDLSLSTQDNIQSGAPTPGVTATQSIQAQQQAKIILGVFGLMIAQIIEAIGTLTMDCIIQRTTVGEVDATVPEALRMKYKAMTMRGTEKGRSITNRIVFTDRLMGRDPSQADLRKREWELFDKAGGMDTDQRIYEVNPYNFARSKFAMWVDADQITDRSMGADKQRKLAAFNMLSDPRVLPYTNPEAVVDDFVIDEYADGDPDKYKRKAGANGSMLGAMMGNGNQPPMPGMAPPPAQPTPFSLPATIPQ